MTVILLKIGRGCERTVTVGVSILVKGDLNKQRKRGGYQKKSGRLDYSVHSIRSIGGGTKSLLIPHCSGGNAWSKREENEGNMGTGRASTDRPWFWGKSHLGSEKRPREEEKIRGAKRPRPPGNRRQKEFCFHGSTSTCTLQRQGGRWVRTES